MYRWAVKMLLATMLAAIPASLGSVAAAAQTSPSGLVGACNMMQSWPGVGHVPAGGGMELAMSRNATQGNAGMNTAVAASGGSCG